MNKQRMIEWIATCNTGVSSKNDVVCIDGCKAQN